MSKQHAAPPKHQVIAAVIGNALEWYDFIVFGFLAVIISRLFFPSESEYSSLLMATATFGVGFFMRPVGGILLGIYADRRGRKAAAADHQHDDSVHRDDRIRSALRCDRYRRAFADRACAIAARVCDWWRIRQCHLLPDRERAA